VVDKKVPYWLLITAELEDIGETCQDPWRKQKTEAYVKGFAIDWEKIKTLVDAMDDNHRRIDQIYGHHGLSCSRQEVTLWRTEAGW
jgi:hypothetical protein